MSIWGEVEKLKEKYNLAHWVVITLMFFGGLFVNATYGIIDWIYLPFDTKKDVTILLEKSEEFSAFIESFKTIQKDINESKTNTAELESEINELNKRLDDRLSEMNIELKAQVRRLEDGQLQLFLKAERLDERTSGTKKR